MTARPLVVFDWNGTVVDDTDRALRATNHVLRRARIPALTLAQFRSRFVLPVRGLLRSLGISESRLAAAERTWNEHLAAVTAPVRPEAVHLLHRLAQCGADLGVVSAAWAEAVESDISASGLDGVFQFVDAAVEDKTATLRERLPVGVPAAYVGDTDYDITCAKAAGYAAIAVSNGYQRASRLHAAAPDLLLGSLSEVDAVLALLAARTVALSTPSGALYPSEG